MMSPYRKLAVVFAASASIMASSVAGAVAISLPSNAQRSWTAIGGGIGSEDAEARNYTAATDTWALATPWGVEGRPQGIYFDDSADFALGLIGSLFITALIDDGGNVYGGSFSWIGETADLGLDSQQILLSGSILGASMPEDASLQNGFFASVDFVNPALSSRARAPDIAILSFNSLEPVWFPNRELRPIGPEWSNDFVFSFEEPRISGFYTVPEPGTLALLGIGLFGMGLARRRKN